MASSPGVVGYVGLVGGVVVVGWGGGGGCGGGGGGLGLQCLGNVRVVFVLAHLAGPASHMKGYEEQD